MESHQGQAKILSGHSDLSKDPSETTDLSSSEAGQLAKMQAFAQKSTNPCDRVFSLIRPGPGTIVTGRPSSGSPAFRLWPFKNAFQRLDHPDLLPTDQIRLLSASSQNEGNDKRARYAIDGKPETIWHTQFSPKLEKHPHELILDLKKVRLISGRSVPCPSGQRMERYFREDRVFSPKTERSFRTSLSPKPFQRKKNLKPSVSRKPPPPASSKYGFFRRAMARNGHPPPRSACSSGDDFRQIRKISPLLLFGHPHLPLPNANH